MFSKQKISLQSSVQHINVLLCNPQLCRRRGNSGQVGQVPSIQSRPRRASASTRLQTTSCEKFSAGKPWLVYENE